MKITKLQRLDEGYTRVMEEDSSSHVEIHVSPKGFGSLGDNLTIDGGPAAAMLARMLAIPDGWHKTKVGAKCWAAYNAGDRLTFFTHEMDFQEDDEAAGIDDMIDDSHPEAKEIKDKLAKRRGY